MRSDGLTRTQQARRADIIEAAIAVVNRDGYPNASIERIAVEAGTSKSTALYHFNTKEAVFTAMLEDLYQRGARYMSERLRDVSDPVGLLRCYLDANLRFIAANSEQVRALHLIIENRPGVIDALDDGLSWLEGLLNSGGDAGAMDVPDVRAAAIAIRAVIDRSAFHFGEPGVDADRYIHATIQLLERMVVRPGLAGRS